MADVFISYSQKDRALAGDLAKFLGECGYDVWWDYNLVGGVKFRDQIKQELAAAKAAIVIWTANSVESEFVIDEAEDAKQVKKLLPTRAPELDFKAIPLGFRQLQTDPVDKPDLILRALDELGVRPSNPPARHATGPVTIGTATVDPANVANAEQFAAWEFIKDSRDPLEFRAYAERFPLSPLAELARTRLANYENEAWLVLNPNASTDPAALQQFIEHFKGGRYEADVRRRLYSLEQDAWARLDKKNGQALAAHLAAYPGGFSAREAQNFLDDMERGAEEVTAWRQLTAKPSRAALEAFLKQFPLSQRAEDARKMLTPVVEADRRTARWALIREQGFSEQLRSFIEEFKTGPEVAEAQKRLAELQREAEATDWARVCDSRVPSEIIGFLAKHPAGAYQDRALAVLIGMPQRAEAAAWEAARANDAAMAGFRAAYPKSTRLALAGAVEADATEPEPDDRAAEPDADTTARPRWRLALWGIAILGTSGAVGALVALGEQMRRVDGDGITALVFVGVLAAALTGVPMYRLGTAWSVRRGRSLELSSAVWHLVALLPLGLWFVTALHAYPRQQVRRQGGLIDNINPGAVGEQTAAAVACMAALLILIAIVSRLPQRWRFRSLLYFGLIGPMAAVALYASWHEITYAGRISDYFLTAVMPERALFAAALLSLFCTERFIWDYRQQPIEGKIRKSEVLAQEAQGKKAQEMKAQEKIATRAGTERLSRSVPERSNASQSQTAAAS